MFLFHFSQELSSVFSLAFKCINPTRTWRTCLAGAALWASYLSLINTFSHPIYLNRVRQTVTTVPCKHVLPHSLEGLWAQTNTPLVEGRTHRTFSTGPSWTVHKIEEHFNNKVKHTRGTLLAALKSPLMGPALSGHCVSFKHICFNVCPDLVIERVLG